MARKIDMSNAFAVDYEESHSDKTWTRTFLLKIKQKKEKN